MKYTVIRQHISNYPEPIILTKGEKVRLGHEYSGTEDWPNWVYCYKLDSSKAGWVPKQIIKKIGKTYGIVKENYTAKELNVEKGEQVECKKKLNGWIWCRKDGNCEEGWVPESNLKEIG